MHKRGAGPYTYGAKLPINTVHMQNGMNFEPVTISMAQTKCAMATFLLCSNVATGLLTGMTKNRPCLSLHLRFGSASTCLAGLSKRAVLSHHGQSFNNNASLAVAMA